MSRFLELTGSRGQQVWVNPNLITSIHSGPKETDDWSTAIHLDHDKVYVKDTAADVVAVMAALP
jgi:uncharacterized protein YlzI (FlbEa/FlbD family)